MSNEENERHDGLLSLLGGIGLGVLIGGAVALLLAPQEGQATRAQLRGSLDDTLSRLRDSMEELSCKVEEAAACAREAMAAKRESSPETGQGEVAHATE